MKEKFLESANLPQNNVSLAAVGNYPEIISVLHNEGIKTLSFENEILPEEVKKHADMLVCHMYGDQIFCDPSIDTATLINEGFTVYKSEKLKRNYPDDVKLNAAVGKGFYVYNPKSIDEYLNDELLLSGFTGLVSNQGYSKCSLCFVTENAFITDDTSIYEALKRTAYDVLLISKGDIYLSDMHYGFIGGSTGKLSKDVLAVTGELKYHKDGDKIREFAEKHGVKIKELIKGRITDIGGILPLKEYVL